MSTTIRNSKRNIALGARKFCDALILGTSLTALSLSPLAAQTVPPPSAGLKSNHNYYLYNGGKPIHGLVITVEITQDIVCSPIGFHVQLNANSPNDSNIHTNWQQYVMGFHPNDGSLGSVVGSSIEYFASPFGFNTKGASPATITGLPGPQTLPAGAKFIIQMEYDRDNISGAKFTYVERGGRNRHEWKIPVPPPGLMQKGSKTPPAPGAAAAWVRTPIVAFQVDLVGRSGGDNAVMQSGGGTITYSASDAMTVSAKKPDSKGQITAETANSVYGLLPTRSSNTFTQTFAFGSTPLGAATVTTGAPGQHPHYLHALSDLRYARALLTALGENNVMGRELDAVVNIDKTIAELKRASIDDGKNLNDHPPVDANIKHKARLIKARTLLDSSLKDLNYDEDDHKALHWRENAIKHDNDAIDATKQAIKDAINDVGA